MAFHLSSPRFRAVDENGAALALGKVYCYAAGTTTPRPVYADRALTAAHPHPVVLDAAGEAVIYLGAGGYTIVLQDAEGVQQWSIDVDGSVAGVMLDDQAVTTAKLAAGALSADAAGRSKMAAKFVTTEKLDDGVLSADANGRAKMADGFITTQKLADAAVTIEKGGTGASNVIAARAALEVPKVDGQGASGNWDIAALKLQSTVGNAPVYGARAWINFDGGLQPPVIRASGNVASIVRNGVGDYTLTFQTALPDGLYAVTGTGVAVNHVGPSAALVVTEHITNANVYTLKTPTQVRVLFVNNDSDQLFDPFAGHIVIFR